MRAFFDSSSLAKRYVQEAGSRRVDALLRQASELAVCILLVPEIVSGLRRRVREGVLSVEAYRKAMGQLLDDIGDATVLQITPAVVSRSLVLLETHPLRAMDALHVGCAREWQADLFVTSDRTQSAAASGSGLETAYVG